MNGYIKYVYWLFPEPFRQVEKALVLRESRKAVCVPLARNVEAGCVRPEAWGQYEICKRQMSWYFRSRFAGKYLVVSSSDLADHGLVPETIITATDFKPGALPDEEQKKAMIARSSYQEAKPLGWEDIQEDGSLAGAQWQRVMGLGGVPFERLFLTHCANHANFLEPAYYVEKDGEKVPYSIGKTKEVCSACMEFYNIIGAGSARKLVVPCPGSVLFAGLAANRYFEVAAAHTT